MLLCPACFVSNGKSSKKGPKKEFIVGAPLFLSASLAACHSKDAEFMQLSYQWGRQAIFAEEMLPFTPGVLEQRKARASETMKKVYGEKEKGSIGEID